MSLLDALLWGLSCREVSQKPSPPSPSSPGSPEHALLEPTTERTWRAEPTEGLESDAGLWPPASLGYEQRFRQPHPKLFPFLGRKVRTPGGPGTLLQVFADRVTVLLDSELSRCSFFRPAEIEPASSEP